MSSNFLVKLHLISSRIFYFIGVYTVFNFILNKYGETLAIFISIIVFYLLLFANMEYNSQRGKSDGEEN